MAARLEAELGLRNHGASSGQTDPTPRRRRPGRRHGGTRPFEAFSPFFVEVFRFFIFVFIFVEVGRSVVGDVVVCQDRLLLSVLQAADPAICATLEGWADRQVLLVCELHRRAQQVVNSDGVQEMLDCLSGDLRAIVVALLVDLGRPGCAKPVCWDGIESLVFTFAVPDKVEGVYTANS